MRLPCAAGRSLRRAAGAAAVLSPHGGRGAGSWLLRRLRLPLAGGGVVAGAELAARDASALPLQQSFLTDGNGFHDTDVDGYGDGFRHEGGRP